VTFLLFKCRWRQCWRAATSGQLTKNIYQLDKYFCRLVNSSLCCTFWCKHRNSRTNGSELITWQTLWNFFLEHPVLGVNFCFLILTHHTEQKRKTDTKVQIKKKQETMRRIIYRHGLENAAVKKRIMKISPTTASYQPYRSIISAIQQHYISPTAASYQP